MRAFLIIMPISPERYSLKSEVDKTEHGELLVWQKNNEVPSSLQENTEASKRFEEGLMVLQQRLEGRAKRLNDVLKTHNLGPEFEPGELLFNPLTGQPELNPDINVLFIGKYIKSEERRIFEPVFVDPMFLGETHERLVNESLRTEHLKPFSDLGKGGVAVTFPANLGPRVPGGKDEYSLLSIVFERKGNQQEPLVILGNRDSLNQTISEVNSPFEKMTFDGATRLLLNTELQMARQEGLSIPEIPESLVSEDPTVKDYSINRQNARFYTFVTLNLKDGKRAGFWMTPGEKYKDGRLRQGSVAVVLHKDKDGESIVAFVSQRRFSGNIEKIELPRGFEKEKMLERGARFAEVSEETGIPEEELEKYQTSSFLVAEDPIRANVEFEFLLAEIPEERRFDLDKLSEAAAAKNRPGALIEELTPSWIRLKDIVEGAVEGTYVTDAHTTSSLFTTLLLKDAVSMAEELEQFGIVLEKFQNFRDGSVRLGIPRGNSQKMDENLRGELNPNTGPCRIWNKIGYSNHTAGLPKGSYEVVGINQLLGDIKQGKVDMVTTSAVFKTLMQKGLIGIDYSKI